MPVGLHVDMAVVEQFVEQDRMACEVVRGPARGAHQVGHALECLRILLQQRQIGAAAADCLDQFEAASQRLFRVLRGGGDLDETWHQRVQSPADLCGQLLITWAVVQFGQLVCHALRVGVAQLTQHRVEGVFAARRPYGVDLVLAVLFRWVAENVVEVAADHFANGSELFEHGLASVELHGASDQIEIVRGVRQVVCLRVVQILQPVLEPAQKVIGAGQLVNRVRSEDAAFRQFGQHPQRRPDLQFAITPAADQLENLCDELDFADATRPDLDVVGTLAARYLAADLRMKVAHGIERAVIEVFAKHEGAGDFLEFGIAFAVERACLDPGVALPLAPLSDEVALQRVERAHQRPGIAVGAQAHVHPEDLPVLGDVGQRLDDAFAESLEEFEVADDLGAAGIAVFRVDENQVDVRRDIELAPAELAHADDDELLLPARG